jgi:hypothetical protein
MPRTNADATRLLVEASRATTLAEQERLVGAAEQSRNDQLTATAAEKSLDLASAVIRDVLTPVAVHEHHTAATDWLGSIDTHGGDGVEQEMVAQGSLWYSKTAGIKPWRDEFVEQARGMARKLAGAYGEQAPAAENAFFRHVATLYNREVNAGLITQAASGVPQVGEEGNPEAGGTVGPQVDYGIDGPQTSSERAPMIQALENNTSVGGDPTTSDPSVLPQDVNNSVPVPNQDHAGTTEGARMAGNTNTRQAPSQTAPCPSCAGRGRVAVRRTAQSGLPQVDQIANADDSPGATPLPTDVAFPWEMSPANVNRAISITEQQLAERNRMQQNGMGAAAARKQRAEAAYRRVMAGMDDSGWLGDMGASPSGPGEQDGGNPGPASNVGQPDPVYGEGGDNGNQPLRPYGADEADDYTNNPGQNWQPGQPAQMDTGGRGMTVGQPTASREHGDPELQRALAFVRQRRAFLAQGR